MRKIEITKNESEQRLDRYLLKYFNNTTRSNIYKLIRKKVFKINGKRMTQEDYFLMENDILEIYLTEESIDAMVKPFVPVKPEKIGLDIVFEDEEILVLNKPKGVLTHPDKSEYKNTLATMVHYYLRDLCTNTFRPAPVHRLDKNTSGVVIFAKTYEALKKYNTLMRERDVEKFYICVVHGKLSKPGEVKGYLIKDEIQNKVRIVARDSDEAKYCHSKYKPLQQFGEYIGEYTLVEVELLTGRSHQIRASMQLLGHSIVGDLKYGGRRVDGLSNQLLHSNRMIIEGRTFEAKSTEIEDFVKLHS
ncbi:RluA family pseudouridine synthase [Fusibacter bizertensis]|jgi:pseudouridine synthase, RluA family|uniref:Pseudouridine synthase n=1 Tax=Fusibacter bizertensis TaxID=1488331 RepID=A0ABT6NET1_9FIRM|nr:RluA family pseudouridine synthase [Fusibacter bizertensis]MDH8678911.1 RluA family pseudouridine synthase [Fusibacter bizertensis]